MRGGRLREAHTATRRGPAGCRERLFVQTSRGKPPPTGRPGHPPQPVARRYLEPRVAENHEGSAGPRVVAFDVRQIHASHSLQPREARLLLPLLSVLPHHAALQPGLLAAGGAQSPGVSAASLPTRSPPGRTDPGSRGQRSLTSGPRGLGGERESLSVPPRAAAQQDPTAPAQALGLGLPRPGAPQARSPSRLPWPPRPPPSRAHAQGAPRAVTVPSG